MVEHILHDNQLIALIVRASFAEPGVHFFTENHYSQQLAFMRHSTGKVIGAHTHNPVQREVQYTQEVLFIRRGKLRVDLYAPDQSYKESHVLKTGDVIFLASGGHGFKVLEDVEMIEVKQGPFLGEQDKTRFDGVAGDETKLG